MKCDKCSLPLDRHQAGMFRNYVGSCDECSAEIKLPGIAVIYIYDDDGKHVFRAITNHRCPGCFAPIFSFQIFCGGLNVTTDMESIGVRVAAPLKELAK